MDIRINFNDRRINFGDRYLFAGSKRTRFFKYNRKQIFTDILLCEYFGFNVLAMGVHDFRV